MATSGTTAFNPDIATLIEEAYDRAGYEGRSGYEYRTAVRSIDFMMAEWSNLGLNLWAVEEGSFAITAGDSQYNLPTDTVDLIDASIRLNGTDYRMERIGVGSWAAISNKSQTNQRPSQYFVERLVTTPRVNIWPVPATAATFLYWRLRRMHDAGTPDKTIDVPYRFLDAFSAGLALRLAKKRPKLDPLRIAELKEEYAAQIGLAMSEDRGRESFFLRVKQ